jgi:hypothetical protein
MLTRQRLVVAVARSPSRTRSLPCQSGHSRQPGVVHKRFPLVSHFLAREFDTYVTRLDRRSDNEPMAGTAKWADVWIDEQINLKPIGYSWSYLACATGPLVPIWQSCTGSLFQ